MKLKKKLITFLLLLFCSFSLIFAEGDSDSDGDDGGDDEYISAYDEYYCGDNSYHDMVNDLYNGDGGLSEWTEAEILAAAQEAEENGDYIYTEVLNDYLENPDAYSKDSESSTDDIVEYVKSLTDDLIEQAKIAMELIENPNIPLHQAQELLDAYGGYSTLAETCAREQCDRWCGDPVAVTTGKYCFSEVDVKTAYGIPVFVRKYLQDSYEKSVISKSWTTNLDSRIVWGSTEISDEEFSYVEKKYFEMKDVYEEAKELSESEMFKYEATTEDYERIENINDWYAEIEEIYDFYQKILSENQLAAKKNSYSSYPNSLYEYNYCGPDTIMLIDEGTPYLLTKCEDDADGFPVYKSNIEYGITLKSYWQPVDSNNNSEQDRMNDRAYEVLYRGNQKKFYNSNGLITEECYSGGEKIVFVRDTDGCVLRAYDSHSVSYEFEYNSARRLCSIKSPNGTSCSYVFNNSGYLMSVTDSVWGTKSYLYNKENLIYQIIKADGNKTSITYKNKIDGSIGRTCVDTVDSEDMGVEKFDFDFKNRTTTYTNSDGIVTIYKYDSNKRITSMKTGSDSEKKYSYNSAGLISKISDGDYQSTYQYDVNGNIVHANYNNEMFSDFEYDEKDFLVCKKDGNGVEIRYTYDDRGNCTRVTRGNIIFFDATYNTENFITSAKQAGKMKNYFTYNSKNQVEKIYGVYNGSQILLQTNKYNLIGELESCTDGLGNKISFVRDGNNVQIVQSSGAKTTLNYNLRKNLVSTVFEDTTTGEIRKTNYEYDSRNNVSKIFNPDLEYPYSSFMYSLNNNIVSESYTDNKETWERKYSYNDYDEVSSIKYAKYSGAPVLSLPVNAESFQINFNYYNESDYVRTITTFGSYINNEECFSKIGTPLWKKTASGDIEQYSYDSAGNMNSVKNIFGGYTDYEFNESGLLASIGERDASKIVLRYDEEGRIAQVVSKEGTVFNYSYDSNENLIRIYSDGYDKHMVYDKYGRLVKIYFGKTESTAVKIVSFDYSPNGKKVVVNYGNEISIALNYNVWGQLVSQTNAAGDSILYQYNSLGQMQSIIDSYGNATKFSYNALNKVSSIVFPDKSKREYIYNALGKVTSIKDDVGEYWYGVYNNSGMLIEEKMRGDVVKNYFYDNCSRLVKYQIGKKDVAKFEYDVANQKRSIFDGKNSVREYFFDKFARVTRIINRAGDAKVYQYDKNGTLVSVVDFAGNKMRKTVDNAGNKISIEYDGDKVKTVYTYDLAGNIIKAENENSVLNYEYNKAGLLVKAVDFYSGETIKYSYDNCGRKKSAVTSDRELNYVYGKANELLEINDAKQNMKINFSYDVNMREVKRVFGNGVYQETKYDEANRKVLIKQVAENGEINFEAYLFNSDGKRSATINHKGQVTLYKYDDCGRLCRVIYPYEIGKILSDAKELAGYDLNVADVSRVPDNYYLSPAEKMEFDSLLQKYLPEFAGIVPISESVWYEYFSYDNNGNRTRKSTSLGAINYSYDSENRLVKAGNVIFDYDKNGNMICKTNSKQKEVYTYNKQNRLAKYERFNSENDDSFSNSYLYDAFGRRSVTRNSDSRLMKTLYDGLSMEKLSDKTSFDNGKFASAFSSDNSYASQNDAVRYRYISDSTHDASRNAVVSDEKSVAEFYGERHYLNVLGKTVAVSRKSGSSWKDSATQKIENVGYRFDAASFDGVAYFGTDILSSVKNVSDASGRFVANFEYDSFGKMFVPSAPNQNSDDSVISEFIMNSIVCGYTSKPFNSETDFSDYGFRDYSPALGRFTSEDPIQDGFNWFNYCDGDPVNSLDLWGLEGEFYLDFDTGEFRGFGRSIDEDGVHYSVCLSVTQDHAVIDVFKGENHERIEINEPNLFTFDVVQQSERSGRDQTFIDYGRTNDPNNPNATCPGQFPTGSWNFTGIEEWESDVFGRFCAKTNAHQELPIANGPNKGELAVDWGYCFHYTAYSNTNGCFGIHNRELESYIFAAINMGLVGDQKNAARGKQTTTNLHVTNTKMDKYMADLKKQKAEEKARKAALEKINNACRDIEQLIKADIVGNMSKIAEIVAQVNLPDPLLAAIGNSIREAQDRGIMVNNPYVQYMNCK